MKANGGSSSPEAEGRPLGKSHHTPPVIWIKTSRSLAVINRNNRQQGARRVGAVVMDGVCCHAGFAVGAQRFPGIRVRVEARIVRAADVNRNPVAFVKDNTG